jgi:uncharacterized membrane protein SpoIIM required for sporulation
MRQQAFEQAERATWGRYRALLDALDGRGQPGRTARRDPRLPLHEFPTLFRDICGHYALARSRGYSPGLTAELHELVALGHRHLYRRRLQRPQRLLGFLARDFPATLRRHLGVFALAMGLLFLPMLAMGLACYQDGELIYSLLDPADVANLESSYDPKSRHPGRDPAHRADGQFAMFGFYVMNNVGIGFRSFGSGVFLGLGSVLILVFNGLFIGAAAGHLTRLGLGETFWPFVVGHGPLELTAIAVCGAAGLLLGQAIWAPGRHTRLAALRHNARAALTLVIGAMVMLILAAVIEAFWSPIQDTGIATKVAFGALWWILLALYFARAGRGQTTEGGRGA